MLSSAHCHQRACGWCGLSCELRTVSLTDRVREAEIVHRQNTMSISTYHISRLSIGKLCTRDSRANAPENHLHTTPHKTQHNINHQLTQHTRTTHQGSVPHNHTRHSYVCLETNKHVYRTATPESVIHLNRRITHRNVLGD